MNSSHLNSSIEHARSVPKLGPVATCHHNYQSKGEHELFHLLMSPISNTHTIPQKKVEKAKPVPVKPVA